MSYSKEPENKNYGEHVLIIPIDIDLGDRDLSFISEMTKVSYENDLSDYEPTDKEVEDFMQELGIADTANSVKEQR